MRHGRVLWGRLTTFESSDGELLARSVLAFPGWGDDCSVSAELRSRSCAPLWRDSFLLAASVPRICPVRRSKMVICGMQRGAALLVEVKRKSAIVATKTSSRRVNKSLLADCRRWSTQRYRGLQASYLRKLTPLRNSETDWQRRFGNCDRGADIEGQAELRKGLYDLVHGLSDSPNIWGKICGIHSISPSFSSNLTFLRPLDLNPDSAGRDRQLQRYSRTAISKLASKQSPFREYMHYSITCVHVPL